MKQIKESLNRVLKEIKPELHKVPEFGKTWIIRISKEDKILSLEIPLHKVFGREYITTEEAIEYSTKSSPLYLSQKEFTDSVLEFLKEEKSQDEYDNKYSGTQIEFSYNPTDYIPRNPNHLFILEILKSEDKIEAYKKGDLIYYKSIPTQSDIEDFIKEPVTVDYEN